MSAIALTIKALLASGDITGRVGNRIYPMVIPQNAALPAIAVNSISDDEELLLDGASQWPEARISIEISSTDGADEVLLIGESIIDWLRDKDRYTVNYGATPYEVTFRKEGTDVTETSEGHFFRRHLDFYVRRRRSP